MVVAEARKVADLGVTLRARLESPGYRTRQLESRLRQMRLVLPPSLRLLFEFPPAELLTPWSLDKILAVMTCPDAYAVLLGVASRPAFIV